MTDDELKMMVLEANKQNKLFFYFLFYEYEMIYF